MEAQQCPVMAALAPKERHKLLDRGVDRWVERDETLHLAGERSERIHLVIDGVLKFVAREGGGNETILGLAAPGDVVGELPAIDGLPQSVDVIAATKAHVMGFDAETFLDVVTTSPGATRCLLELQAARLRWIYSSALERSASEVPARIAGRLLDLADMIGRVEDGSVALDLPLQQTELGRLAGVCRESACKTLRRFKSEGLVDYRGRRLRILRPDALERIRCAGRV